MAQSLEELSSIYSEASELGLTSLGVTQPNQQLIEGATGDSASAMGLNSAQFESIRAQSGSSQVQL